MEGTNKNVESRGKMVLCPFKEGSEKYKDNNRTH
jgi:hypothetical protein